MRGSQRERKADGPQRIISASRTTRRPMWRTPTGHPHAVQLNVNRGSELPQAGGDGLHRCPPRPTAIACSVGTYCRILIRHL